jgi:DNA-binding CsgD family transcriptional regulator
LTGDDMMRLSGLRSTPVTTEVFPKVGLTCLEQLRVLVCDGPHLLTWLGVLRDEPFTHRERWLVQALIAPLRRRLVLERRLAAGAMAEAGLAAAMERLGSPAFLLARRRIAHGNAAGQALRRDDPATVEALLRGEAERVGFDEVRVAVRGLPEHRLVVRRRDRVADAPHRAAAASRAWSLTPRETSVLALIARGLCNKDISSALGCAESTAEVHVTSLLRKAGCCARTELVARFWTESFDDGAARSK